MRDGGIYIYFVKPVDARGPIKIGQSKNPEARFSGIQEWAPEPLEIIALVHGPKDLERRFHAAFLNSHLGREWFAWSKRLQETIDAILAETFDYDALPEPFLLNGGNGLASGHYGRKFMAGFVAANAMDAAA